MKTKIEKKRESDRYGYLITGLSGDKVSELSKEILSKFKNDNAVHMKMLVYTPEMAKKSAFYSMDLRKHRLNIGGTFTNEDVIFIAPPKFLAEFYNDFLMKKMQQDVVNAKKLQNKGKFKKWIISLWNGCFKRKIIQNQNNQMMNK
jgi:hypothetical protein